MSSPYNFVIGGSYYRRGRQLLSASSNVLKMLKTVPNTHMKQLHGVIRATRYIIVFTCISLGFEFGY